MCTAEFTTALLPLSKTWKPPGCPARDEWRRNMGYSHTMAHHSAGTTDAIQPFVTTRMAGRVLGEVKQAPGTKPNTVGSRSEEHTSELQSRQYLVCRLLLEKKKKLNTTLYCKKL